MRTWATPGRSSSMTDSAVRSDCTASRRYCSKELQRPPRPRPRGQIEAPPPGHPGSATIYAADSTHGARVIPARGLSSPRQELELAARRCCPPRHPPHPSPGKYRQERSPEPPPPRRSPTTAAGLGLGAAPKVAPPPSPNPGPPGPPRTPRPSQPWESQGPQPCSRPRRLGAPWPYRTHGPRQHAV